MFAQYLRGKGQRRKKLAEVGGAVGVVGVEEAPPLANSIPIIEKLSFLGIYLV